jgi:hypothetical protein
MPFLSPSDQSLRSLEAHRLLVQQCADMLHLVIAGMKTNGIVEITVPFGLPEQERGCKAIRKFAMAALAGLQDAQAARGDYASRSGDYGDLARPERTPAVAARAKKKGGGRP